MNEQEKKPDLAAGIFALVFGAACFILAIFVHTTALTPKLLGLGCGIYLLGWGRKQVRGATKAKKLDDTDKEG
jgi:hypothetical protein